MSKLRVWWVPQVPMKSFCVPVNTVEEGKKVLDILAAYDLFQLQHNVKPDFCNMGGLEICNEEDQEWYDWDMETKDTYYENVDEYCEECEQSEELKQFSEELFAQIDFSKLK